MKEFIGMVEQSLRSFFKDKINMLIAINVIGFLVLVILIMYNYNQLDKVKRKVDHRYYNMTNTMQDVYGVEIDTQKGRVVKRFKVIE